MAESCGAQATSGSDIEFLPGATPFSAVFLFDSLAYAAEIDVKSPLESEAAIAQAKAKCTDLLRVTINSLVPGGLVFVAEQDAFLTCTEILQLLDSAGFCHVEVRPADGIPC